MWVFLRQHGPDRRLYILPRIEYGRHESDARPLRFRNVHLHCLRVHDRISVVVSLTAFSKTSSDSSGHAIKFPSNSFALTSSSSMPPCPRKLNHLKPLPPR